nr:MAG TPA: hypothetical protein [Caudoviricetes sp.]
MNVAAAAALLNAWVDAGEGQLPLVVATAIDSDGNYAMEQAADIAPITSPPPAHVEGTWADQAEAGKPHTAIAIV